MMHHDQLLRDILIERTGVSIEAAERMIEIRDILNRIEEICSHYEVLNDERYGSEAVAYQADEVPTNRQFWRECGVADEDIETPDEHVPTVELLEYVPEPDGFPKRDITRIGLPVYDTPHQDVPKRIRTLLERLEKVLPDDDSEEMDNA